MQAGVAPLQTIPHPPQFDGSKEILVQTPKQSVPPPGQTTSEQVPWSQVGAESGQTLPQAPQLAGSVLRKVHVPLQSTAPGAQSY
jgi:hypothetical protein